MNRIPVEENMRTHDLLCLRAQILGPDRAPDSSQWRSTWENKKGHQLEKPVEEQQMKHTLQVEKKSNGKITKHKAQDEEEVRQEIHEELLRAMRRL